MFSKRSFLQGLATQSGYSPLPLKKRAAISGLKSYSQTDNSLPQDFYVPSHHDVMTSLNFLSVARQCLMVDNLGSFYVPRYEGGGDVCPAFVYNKHGVEVAKAKEIFVPMFPYEKSAKSTLKETKKVVEYFADLENRAFLSLLPYVEQEVLGTEFSNSLISAAFRQIEQHDLMVCKLLCSKSGASRITSLNELFKCSNHEFKCSNHKLCQGHVWAADIVTVSDELLDSNTFYCLGNPNIVGVLPERCMSIMYNAFWYDAGMAIINPYSVSRFKVIDFK